MFSAPRFAFVFLSRCFFHNTLFFFFVSIYVVIYASLRDWQRAAAKL